MLVSARQDLGEDIVAVLVDVEKGSNGRVQPVDGDQFITLLEEMGSGCAELRKGGCTARDLQPALGKRARAAIGRKRAWCASGTRCAVHGDDFEIVGQMTRPTTPEHAHTNDRSPVPGDAGGLVV